MEVDAEAEAEVEKVEDGIEDEDKTGENDTTLELEDEIVDMLLFFF